VNLELDGLSKQYKGKIWGLRDFSLSIDTGVLGLLGPNGAGKSTLMRILATVTKPTHGTASWNNSDIAGKPDAVRRILGYLPQDFGVYPNLNAVEFLTYLAAARGLTGKKTQDRITQLLELVNMIDARKRPLGSLSGGMKQRVGIAQALLNDPQLLIVDEPTAGLDPQERIRFRNLLSELAGSRVVILSSHIVSDIEAVAMSIAIMDRGRLLVHGEPGQLLRKVEGRVWEVEVAASELADLKNSFTVGNTTTNRMGVRARVIGPDRPGSAAQQVPGTLEDVYLYLMTNNTDSPENE